jgi:hypothetical protein
MRMILSRIRTWWHERITRSDRTYVKPPKGEVPPHCPICKEGVAYEGATCESCGDPDPMFINDETGKPLPVGAGKSVPTWEQPGTRSYAARTGTEPTISDVFFGEGS